MTAIIQIAYEKLYPNGNFDRYIPKLKYSGKFSSYNGNIKLTSRNQLTVSLSRNWQDVDDDIVIGIIQTLMCKLFKTHKETIEMKLYNNFIKNLSEYSKISESDDYLVEAYEQLNDEYFNGMMNRPNLHWGKDSTTVLGHYEYATDTITLSTILKEEPILLEYVLYHEMLHKKHKFKTTGTRSLHHSKAFKEDESKFRVADIEKQLQRFVTKKRIKKRLAWW
ncbi:SprT-like domain-containing protein [Candidatus Woesearchaeota archaeon]|nr:SprT-like domain-containing protein [Candidatus Woesearchaeota archaeon]